MERNPVISVAISRSGFQPVRTEKYGMATTGLVDRIGKTGASSKMGTCYGLF